MVLDFFKNRRRKQLLAEPFPEAWLEFLQRNVRHYGLLNEQQRAKLRDLVVVFVAEKDWEGCGGLEMDDEIRVTIAGQACLLALGVEPNFYFDRVETVLVYPDTFVVPGRASGGIVVDEGGEPLLGEAWHRGPIILSWEAVRHGANVGDDNVPVGEGGPNVVLHEFAHHLDGLDGVIDGVPPLSSRDEVRNWHRVTEREFDRLVEQSEHGQATLLDAYGATNNAEFFAVATECFFEKPREMRSRHRELYGALGGFYKLDPAEWRPEI